jgi:ribose-phosphate pyrophosphokinase
MFSIVFQIAYYTQFTKVKMKILACNSNLPLAQKIAKKLNKKLVDIEVKKFSDEEIFIEINENVRGEDVFVLQSTSYPTNDHLMELLICIDALKRASARRITAVIPYYGYSRQDRKAGPRTPISAKLVANLLTVAGANRVLNMDLHAGQIQGFFDIPLDNLYAAPIFVKDIEKNFDLSNTVIVSPDVGGVARARLIAKKLELDLAIIDKRREKAGVSEVMNIIGDIKGKDCIFIDDMVDSAGTLCNAAAAVKKQGAKSVSAYATHGILSGPAIERIQSSELKELVITDTINNVENEKKLKNLRIVSASELIGAAIDRISQEKSVSILFD